MKWLLVLLMLPVVGVASGRSFGDEDPYPLRCEDFSGSWRSDEGEVMNIAQGNKCDWVKLRAALGSRDREITIVPDGKARVVSGNHWKGMVRYRWNDKANTIESHKTMEFSGGQRVVTELVLLEKVNSDLVLESIYRSTRNIGERQPKNEYFQNVFRRISGPKKADF